MNHSIFALELNSN